MARTLRIYVIREVATPILLALLMITFILLIGRVYEMINLLLQPGVKMSHVLEVLAALVPSILLLATPMALLIGVLIGVGRLMLDREILAMRASGVNLLKVFFPMILLSLVVSLALMALSTNVIPKMVLAGMARINNLATAVVTALEPGQFHDKLGGKNSDFTLYFRERDPQTHAMKGIMIRQETEFKPKQSKIESATDGALGNQAHAALIENQETSQTIAIDPDSMPDTELTMVFAEQGVIQASLDSESGQSDPKTAIVLNLTNGSLHRLTPDPDDKEYAVTSFKKGKVVKLMPGGVEKFNQARSNAELRQIERETKPLLSEDKKYRKIYGEARQEIFSRYSVSLSSMVFVLMAIPLAIWMRPTGKSWGILLAIGLMLVYYLLMRMGLSLVEANHPLGVPMTFLPTLVYLVLGAGLWWQTLRS